MKFHELKASRSKLRQRVGRGIGSGSGKTAGRGTKGQRARSGVSLRPGFEGGQNPLVHRLPKLRGFKAPDRKTQLIYTDQLNAFKGSQTVTKAKLHEAGLIASSSRPAKLLLRGEVKQPVIIEIDQASRSAQTALTKAGGTVKLTAKAKSTTKPATKDRSKSK